MHVDMVEQGLNTSPGYKLLNKLCIQTAADWPT